jgi:hypothetical protein
MSADASSARATHCRRIVHLAVYGPVEGVVHEDAPLDPSLGCYGQAKCQAASTDSLNTSVRTP